MLDILDTIYKAGFHQNINLWAVVHGTSTRCQGLKETVTLKHAIRKTNYK